MNIRVLRSFLCVCRTASISKAAEQLHISQPALSRQIQELENELDTKLFVRETRRMHLTESGFLLQLRAQEIVDIAERTKREIAESGDFLSGIVKLGCVESAAINFVLDKFIFAKAKYPSVLFEAYSADGDDIRTALDTDKIDMGIVLEPIEAAKYKSIELPVVDRWGVVVKTDSPVAALSGISPAETAKLPLILPRRHIVIDHLTEWMGVEVKNLNIVMFHNLPTLSIRFVAGGFGALLCVEGAYKARPMDGVVFVPITPDQTVRHMLIRRRNRRLGKASEIFWRHAEEVYDNSESTDTDRN